MNSPHPPDPWSGRLIGDRQRYRLGLRLGEGGMGYVFLAMDTLLGQQVALKLLKETWIGSGELRKRFEREVALSAALKSEHIVQVTDFGVTPEGHPFYVMEYLRGQTLGQLLRHDKQLSDQQTVDIVIQICEGLRLAHEGVTLWRNGATTREHVSVVHRDLKPDNIFLETKAQGDSVKILDFGIAKIRDDTAEHTNITNMFIGTFHYAAPEQLGIAQDLDGRADIYSLGIILYEMLSGTDPFGLGLNINKISGVSWVLAHTSKPAVPLRAQPGCQHLSPALEAVVMRCIEKVPDERFASVDQLSQALQAAVVPGEASDRTSPQQHLQQTILSEDITKAIEVATHWSTGGDEQEECEQKRTVNIQQLYPFNQFPRQHLQQSLEPRKAVADGKAKVTENHLHPSSPVRNPQNQRTQQLLAIGLAIIATVGLVHYAYTQWENDRAASAILASTKTLKAGKKHQECVNQAKAVPQKSRFYTDAQNLLSECQRLVQDEKWLAQAQELAKKNKFKDAISTVGAIHSASIFHLQAEQLTNQWSKNLLNQAQELYKQSYEARDLEKAIDITKAIPKTSSVAENAEQMRNKWRAEWNRNETYLQGAEDALRQGKAKEAIDKISQVRLLGQEVKQDTSYWQNKMKPIVGRAIMAASAVRPVPLLRSYQSAPIQTYRTRSIPPRQSAPIPTYRTRSTPLRQSAPTRPRQPQKTQSAWTEKVL